MEEDYGEEGLVLNFKLQLIMLCVIIALDWEIV